MLCKPELTLNLTIYDLIMNRRKVLTDLDLHVAPVCANLEDNYVNPLFHLDEKCRRVPKKGFEWAGRPVFLQAGVWVEQMSSNMPTPARSMRDRTSTVSGPSIPPPNLNETLLATFVTSNDEPSLLCIHCDGETDVITVPGPDVLCWSFVPGAGAGAGGRGRVSTVATSGSGSGSGFDMQLEPLERVMMYRKPNELCLFETPDEGATFTCHYETEVNDVEDEVSDVEPDSEHENNDGNNLENDLLSLPQGFIDPFSSPIVPQRRARRTTQVMMTPVNFASTAAFAPFSETRTLPSYSDYGPNYVYAYSLGMKYVEWYAALTAAPGHEAALAWQTAKEIEELVGVPIPVIEE